MDEIAGTLTWKCGREENISKMNESAGMDLTVVVPIYNVEDYLEKCLDSIVNQTYKRLFAILVDDGSTDRSGEIADKYAKKYDNISVIHQNNQGLSAARNTGIDNCTTELIAFVDSDDYIESNMYEVLITRLTQKKADISIGGVYKERFSGEKRSLYPAGIECEFSKKEALVEINSYKYFNMSVCNVVFRTELFNVCGYGESGVRFPIGKTSEDEYVVHKLYARAERIAYTSAPFYHYVQRENSISRSDSISLEFIEAAKSRLEFYSKWFPEIAYTAKAECVITCMAITNCYIARAIEFPNSAWTYIRETVKENCVEGIIINRDIRFTKRIQALVFIVFPNSYKVFFPRIRKLLMKG